MIEPQPTNHDRPLEDEMTDTTTEAPAEKPAKAVPAPRACICSRFEIGSDGARETTGCRQESIRGFAQGHDAKLASFLVTAYAENQEIRENTPEGTKVHATPSAAVADVSAALQTKVERMTENAVSKRDARLAREAARAQAKAEREAEAQRKKDEREAKKNEAKPPREVGAKVAEGTVVSDGPSRFSIIKVGRHEYEADIDPNTKVATYRDQEGVEQTREEGAYRLRKLADAPAA
jgi:hypothetical protein